MTTFSEDAPRPPVPGGGGDDDCSTTAYQTTSCVKRLIPVMSNVHPATGNVGLISAPSACVTKCCLHTTADSHFHQDCSERGCEPDGCVRIGTKFAENVNPCHFDDNFKHLLEDSSGVSYFRRFLSSGQSSEVLEFWLACSGFRKVEGGKQRAVAFAIFKKFIARSSERLGISNATKLTIKERLKYGRVEASLYDNAFGEVETQLCRYFYPMFMNSKEYADYLRSSSNNVSPKQVASNGQSSPCAAELTGKTSRSNISCAVGDGFVSLKTTSTSQIPVAKEHIWQPTCLSNRNFDEETLADDSDYCTVGRSISPSRGPVTSIQGSQSSGALTDETFSLTDSSLSLDDRDRGYFSKTACPLCPNCCHGNSRSYVSRQSASHLRFPFRGGNLSEKDPLQFARLLSDRLNQVFQSQGREATPKQNELFRDGASGVSVPAVHSNSTSSFSKMSAVNSALLVVTAGEQEESAQSILERHVSRVFDSPDAQQTPTRSIDCQSVVGLSQKHPSALLDVDCHNRIGCLKGTGQEPVLAAANVDEITTTHMTRTAYPPLKTVHQRDWAEPVDTEASSDCHLPAAIRRCEDYIDTIPHHVVSRIPVGGLVPRTQQVQPTCNHTCANDKVLTWMLVNDQMHSTDVRSTHPEINTPASTLPHKIDPNDWSTGNKSDGLASRTSLPSQLIVQDPMMPLLNPPDPGTQLEEARRRLQLESTKRMPPKSMMCNATVLSPDRESLSISSGATQQSIALHRSLLLPSHFPDENQIHLNRMNSMKSKSSERRMTSLPSTPMQPPASALIGSSSNMATTVVYFLCDEPIPYSTKVNSKAITLAKFKELVAKKGSYRYYFKCACNDFNSGYVYEEVMDDDAILPLIEDKICAKVIRSV